MKALVVYDSVYGNTETVARAIGETLPAEVQVLRVGQVTAGELETVDLLVTGSPTHVSLPTEAVQALVEKIGPPAREGAQVATFDTRLTWGFLDLGRVCRAQNGRHAHRKGMDARRRTGRLFRQGPQEGAAQAG